MTAIFFEERKDIFLSVKERLIQSIFSQEATSFAHFPGNKQIPQLKKSSFCHEIHSSISDVCIRTETLSRNSALHVAK